MRVIDLTGALEENVWLYAPEFPAYSAELATTLEVEGFQVHRVTISTHMGTHTDAPGHLIAGAGMVDTMPLDLFIGPATLLRVGPCSKNEEIGRDKLSKAGNALQPGDIAVIETDWDRHWYDDDYVLDGPFLTPDGAQWLVDQGVKCVGMDTSGLMDPRIDLSPGDEPDTGIVDEILLRAGVPYVTALTNLSKISSDRFWFVGLPMKLKGMDGAPVRAVAIEDFVDV